MAGGIPTHPVLDFPKNGSEIKAQAEAMRQWHNRMYDVIGSYAHDVEKGLRKAQGHRLAFGLDTYMAARRTIRPLMKAAEYHRNQARCWVRYVDLFEENFQSTSGRHATSGRRIDVNR